MPTAVEDVQMADGSVSPGPPDGENALPDEHLNPGSEKGSFSWGMIIAILIGLLLLLFLGGVFAPPGFLTKLLNFTIPADQLGALQCPSDPSVGDPTGLYPPDPGKGDTGKADPPGGDGLLLPAVQNIKPNGFQMFMFNFFEGLNNLRMSVGQDGFLPPGPCKLLGSQPPAPPPGGVAGTPTPTTVPNPCPQGFLSTGNDCAPPPTEMPVECAAGWLPSSGCTCCGSTLVCSDGSIGEFNPQCTGGGGKQTCTCVSNLAAVGGYHCAETGAVCTP